MMRMMAFAAVVLGSGWALPATAQAGSSAQAYYPAFCQGMSIDNGENRMFVSGTFLYPQSATPQDGVLREGSAGSEFAREVQRRSGKALLDSVCHSRPTAEEITEFADTTVRSNGAGWQVETVDWRPRGARVLTAQAPATADRAGSAADPLAIGVPSAAAVAREEAATRSAAAREAEAARAAAEEQANAERLREANAKALAAAAEQTRRIEAEKQAAAARLAQFEAEQKAYEKAKADYQAGVAAADAARRQWEADVAACRAGDRTKCGPVQ